LAGVNSEAQAIELFLAVSLSGLSGLGCSLQPMRTGVNTKLVPIRLGNIYMTNANALLI
jgi:hypothetical protein